MSRALFPYLKGLKADALQADIAATADGYPLRTNRDKHPTLGACTTAPTGGFDEGVG
jgi:hypothetical protein